jgi:hypothetical protein
MPRASDSPGYRASDSASVLTWASDPDGPDAWASDPAWPADERRGRSPDPATDSRSDPATDPVFGQGPGAWGATDPGMSPPRRQSRCSLRLSPCKSKSSRVQTSQFLAGLRQ